MIKKTAICAFLFFSFLLSAFFPEGRVFADTSVDVDDPLNLLLTGDDLLPLCDWQQMQIVTRPIAAGMMTFHTLYCNDEGIERRVFQTILVTRRNFRPGDGNALITGADIGKDQSHIDIGNWATHFSAMHDNAAVVFTEQNVFEYIGINYEYSMGGKNDENLVELARIAADRIPDRKVEPEIQSINTGQSVDNEFVESISKNRPDVRDRKSVV